MKLVYTDRPNVEVKIGDTVTDFRGATATVTSVGRPKNPGSTGRMYTDKNPSGCYPSVYGCEWVEREDR